MRFVKLRTPADGVDPPQDIWLNPAQVTAVSAGLANCTCVSAAMERYRVVGSPEEVVKQLEEVD